jgi:hypothetical protein
MLGISNFMTIRGPCAYVESEIGSQEPLLDEQYQAFNVIPSSGGEADPYESANPTFVYEWDEVDVEIKFESAQPTTHTDCLGSRSHSETIRQQFNSCVFKSFSESPNNLKTWTMAPSLLQQRRTHNTLLFQKLLNLRDGASPFTLVLDSLEQRSGPVVREFAKRAKVRISYLTPWKEAEIMQRRELGYPKYEAPVRCCRPAVVTYHLALSQFSLTFERERSHDFIRSISLRTYEQDEEVCCTAQNEFISSGYSEDILSFHFRGANSRGSLMLHIVI